MMINFDAKRNGFGIIEVLIASTIIAMVLSALTAAGRSSLRGSTYTLERAQATNLAQEGIEIVRQIRDTYWIDGDPLTGFENLPANGNKSLYFDKIKNKWDLLSGSNDKTTINGIEFTREIIFSDVGSLIPASGDLNSVKNEMSRKITVKVSWQNNMGGIEVSEILTNWRPNY